MPDAPERPPRRDDTAADVGTLVRLGREEPQPIPAPSIQPFQEPVYPGLPGGWTPDDAA
ncbi:hypothetical protein ACIF8T_21345 [Streptomyces sp. NPDC085946]|uniref:hypothetical protein n=1 Tax=Streptomyces sp. NPDC085946 TaxID=3365744 RepID=UPI0037D06258